METTTYMIEFNGAWMLDPRQNTPVPFKAKTLEEARAEKQSLVRRFNNPRVLIYEVQPSVPMGMWECVE